MAQQQSTQLLCPLSTAVKVLLQRLSVKGNSPFDYQVCIYDCPVKLGFTTTVVTSFDFAKVLLVLIIIVLLSAHIPHVAITQNVLQLAS